MRNITNDALRMLYRACKQHACFPGELPTGTDERGDDVSIHEILQGLGLIANASEMNIPPDSLESGDSIPAIRCSISTDAMGSPSSLRSSISYIGTGDLQNSPQSAMPPSNSTVYTDIIKPVDDYNMFDRNLAMQFASEPADMMDVAGQAGQSLPYIPALDQTNQFFFDPSTYLPIEPYR